MKRSFWLMPVAVVLILALLPIWRGVPAPELTVTDIQGRQMALSPARQSLILVTFWASDCLPCLQEIPELIDLYQRYRHLGLELIAVAMAYDPPSRVVDVVREKHLPYPVILDTGGKIAAAFGGVSLTPTTFIIDSQGMIVDQSVGRIDFSGLVERITE